MARTRRKKWTTTDPEDYPIWGYAAWNEFRDPLAEFVGCIARRDRAGSQRHRSQQLHRQRHRHEARRRSADDRPGTRAESTPWQLKAKRYGIVMKKVTLPRAGEGSGAQVLNLFNDAITPRTRVLFFSHITTDTGVVLPAKGVVRLGAEQGLIFGG